MQHASRPAIVYHRLMAALWGLVCLGAFLATVLFVLFDEPGHASLSCVIVVASGLLSSIQRHLSKPEAWVGANSYR